MVACINLLSCNIKWVIQFTQFFHGTIQLTFKKNNRYTTCNSSRFCSQNCSCNKSNVCRALPIAAAVAVPTTVQTVLVYFNHANCHKSAVAVCAITTTLASQLQLTTVVEAHHVLRGSVSTVLTATG